MPPRRWVVVAADGDDEPVRRGAPEVEKRVRVRVTPPKSLPHGDTSALDEKLAVKVSFFFQGAQASEVLEYVSQVGALNIVFDDTDADAVPMTVTLNDVTARDAIDVVTDISKLDWKVKGAVIHVAKRPAR